MTSKHEGSEEEESGDGEEEGDESEQTGDGEEYNEDEDAEEDSLEEEKQLAKATRGLATCLVLRYCGDSIEHPSLKHFVDQDWALRLGLCSTSSPLTVRSPQCLTAHCRTVG